MAEFNPSTRTNETQASSQLGYSQGTGTDRSFETLFSGLGDLIGGAAKTTDNAIQNRIEKEARYGYESTNDEMNLSVDTVPSELTRTNDGLQKLATAHMQGKVTSEYYYSRLASSLKGLRARYPGYERQVDEIVQSVTGVNPANAYRNALLQNIESQQSAMASAQNKQDQWANTKENSEVLGIIAPDYWTNQEKYSTPAAQAELKSRVSQYQGRTRLAEDTVKLTNANKDVARPQLGQYLGTIASGYVVGTGEAANVDSPNVQNMITKALSDGTVDSTEKEQINGFIAMQRSQAEAHMRREFATKEWSGNFTSTEREQEIKNSLLVFDNMQELINNDQISSAAQIASRNKAQLDQKTAEVYQKYPELQTAGAIRNIAGDQAAQVLVDNLVQSVGGGQQFLKTLTPDSKIMAQDGAAAVIKGNMTIDQMADAFTEMGGKAGAEKEAMVAATLNATTSALANPGVDPETRKNTVKNTYSTKLDGIWSKVDNSTDASGMSQRSRLFNKMFSPEITKQVAALNDPESLQIYTAAAADKFQQIPEFRKAAAALSQDLPYAQYLRVEYDPERNKMIMSVNREALGNAGFFTRSDQNTINSNLQPFVTSLNQALSTMAPIIEASGVDETEGVMSLMEQLNLNLNEGKTTGIFGHINQALETLMSPVGEGSQSEDRQRATDPNQTGVFEEIDTGDPTQLDEDASIEFTAEDSTVAQVTRGISSSPDATELNSYLSDVSLRSRLPAGMRNNNPGNIKYVGQRDSIGPSENTDQGDPQAVYATPEQGMRAMYRLLAKKYAGGKTTPKQMIAGNMGWTPGNYQAARNVARTMGIGPDDDINFNDPSMAARFMQALIIQEHGNKGRLYPEGMIDTAIAMAN